MRKGDDLFFAPGVRFSELALEDGRFVNQLRQRVVGFYLQPARLCIDNGHAFAAGVLLVSTIDFLAGLHHSAEELPYRKVGLDFMAFVRETLKSFSPPDLARQLYEDFRNGLTHEARVKNAGEFSFDHQQTACVAGGRLCINPQFLLGEVEKALDSYVKKLAEDTVLRDAVAKRTRALFSAELGLVDSAQAG